MRGDFGAIFWKKPAFAFLKLAHFKNCSSVQTFLHSIRASICMRKCNKNGGEF